PAAGGARPAARGTAVRPATIRDPLGRRRPGRGGALHGPIPAERNDAMKRIGWLLLVLVFVTITGRVSGQTPARIDPEEQQKLPDDEATATSLEDIEVLGRLL